MRDNLAEVVESVRSRAFSDMDPALAQQIIEIEKQHVEDRPRAQEGVARAIQQHLNRSAEA
ncbi:hypothetical protein EVU97_00540 [Dermacoccus sp. 147Ba]|uniref:hypothetical protein n=1 Tax=Dermacoccus sp. 147Ba TaxID=2510111 RepID=UPI00101C6F9E|nr:hypothetical protein [Dermacoccus sp. 147Ba]RYI24246.1 hypothetical protein EVU97_00540 [Dermacoccus sp. 147Ba]